MFKNKYLFDTSTCSLLMANHTQIKAHLAILKPNDYIFTCTIVRGEILFGIERLPIGRKRNALENQATNLFTLLPCEAVPKLAGNHYAYLKREAEKQGTPLDENDLWIAATALALNAILVTADRDFQRIIGLGLRLEDWTTIS
jgi:tRNA(fMet)-specific endonuclease VapC